MKRVVSITPRRISLFGRRRRKVKLLAWGWLVAFALLSSGATPQATPIQNDVFWKDTSGNYLYSQGGGVLKVGDTYYWYGVHYARAATYAADPSSRGVPGGASTPGGSPASGKGGFRSITCYSSTDLVHWKFESDALTRDQAGRGWVGRFGVVYNAHTQKYILIGQGSSPQGVHGEYFATSDTPTGPFKFDNVQPNLPFIDNGGTGDQTTFQDDDGSAYVICSSKKGRDHLYVAPLRTSDFLAIQSATLIFQGAGREGNCMFKYKDRYYFCSSNLHGWNASPTYVISATHILGPYGPESIIVNTDLDFSHVTQSGFFITVNGASQSTVIYAGDRWSDFGGNGIGYNQWCPLSFEGITPVFHSLSQWDFDVTTGDWSAGPGNNYILNPSFEADRVSQHVLAGWTNTSNIPGADPNGNSKGAAHTGNFCMQQRFPADYKASMFQNVTGLPNGTYTLSAWVKSSGGQNSAILSAKNFGGSDMSCSLAAPMDAWTSLSIPGIRVTNGQCQVAIISDAKANNWLQVDDVSLVNALSSH